MGKEDGETFRIECPCCKAELLIDTRTQSVLHHAEPAPAPAITDFAAEVKKIQNAGAQREEAFQRSLAAERTREERMGRKFEELLKRARTSPDGKPLKDIDL